MFYKSTHFLYFSQFKRFSVSILGMVRGRANMNALENTYSIIRRRGEVHIFWGSTAVNRSCIFACCDGTVSTADGTPAKSYHTPAHSAESCNSLLPLMENKKYMSNHNIINWHIARPALGYSLWQS